MIRVNPLFYFLKNSRCVLNFVYNNRSGELIEKTYWIILCEDSLYFIIKCHI